MCESLALSDIHVLPTRLSICDTEIRVVNLKILPECFTSSGLASHFLSLPVGSEVILTIPRIGTNTKRYVNCNFRGGYCILCFWNRGGSDVEAESKLSENTELLSDVNIGGDVLGGRGAITHSSWKKHTRA